MVETFTYIFNCLSSKTEHAFYSNHYLSFFFFFFSSRRRHTRYWRDWSSDVCSSDLIPMPPTPTKCTWRVLPSTAPPQRHRSWFRVPGAGFVLVPGSANSELRTPNPEIGRASCRERV